jgi:flagellar protein FlaG
VKIGGAEKSLLLTRAPGTAGLININNISNTIEKKASQGPVPSAKDNVHKAPQAEPGELDLSQAIAKANLALQGPKTSFRFLVHEGTQEIMVRIINEETGDVIREIPPEKILDMLAKMWELMGLFVDEKR